MSVADQKQFTDAVARYKAKSGFFTNPTSLMIDAFNALNRMAMFDMLPALATMSFEDRLWFTGTMLDQINVIGRGAYQRMESAAWVIDHREIRDFGIPAEQVNDQREFLGCTRLDDDGVKKIITDALSKAKEKFQKGESNDEPCCGVFKIAWLPVLAARRQQQIPGISLVSNLAAAAHYMLARYHVCAARATQWQMNIVIDGYDEKKRAAIANGDRDLKSMGITGNRPFPPDFAIRNWAVKGSADGEEDRLKCNSTVPLPLVIPDIGGI
jgi:hypothetical protein